MATLSEGIFPCEVLDGFFGVDDKNSPIARINVLITDGPDKGQRCTYEDQVNAKSALYVSRSCMAVGWRGKALETLAEDVAAWIKKTGGASTVEIRHIAIKKGRQYDQWVESGSKGDPPIWAKPNSIGRGPKPLAKAHGETLNDANDAMRRAMQADGGAPEEGYDPERNPFLTSSVRDASAIAKVLR